MNKTLLPKLRFPEFQDSPAWKKTPLEDSVTPVVRQVEKPKNPYTGLGIRSHGKGTFLKPLELPEKNAMEYLYTVQSDDLIVNITFAWEGAIAIVKQGDSGALVSHRFPTYTFNRDIAIPEFFQYVILDKRFIYNLGVISPGGAGRNRVLNKNDFLKLTVSVPDVSEQQKIADCLTSLDDLIAAQSQKVAALKAYKKGLMQNLFPAEGESAPRLRFPEFESAGEWEVNKLRNVSPAVFDGTHQTPTYTTEGVPFYSVENIVSGAKNKFISHDDYAIATNKNKPEKGDILLTRIGKIGFSQVVTWDFDFSIYVTLAVIKGAKSFVSHYLHYFMQSNRYQTELFSKSLLNAVPQKINMDSLRDTEILLPSPEEQQRIAELFIALDEQISAQGDTLAALKVHKKGLMQGLFPAAGWAAG